MAYLGWPTDLNLSNRRMRSRMYGGVAGVGVCRPYADRQGEPRHSPWTRFFLSMHVYYAIGTDSRLRDPEILLIL